MARYLAVLLSGVVVQIAATPAFAQIWPSKPIRLIVPFTPGGNTDIQARLIGQHLAHEFGQPVLIENRGGAGGTVGVAAVAKAPPDGYTIVFASFGNILVGASLYPNLPYDPLKDFEPIILVSEPAGMLVVHVSLPVKTVRDLIALARARPDALAYGSAGNGTWNHLFAEQFKSLTGTRIAHVPYKGAGPALTDLIGGHIQVMFAPFPSALPQLAQKRLRALAVTGAQRSAAAPDVPTVAESGLPGYQAASWFAILAPAGTPKPVISRLNTEINRALASPEMRRTLAAEGIEPTGGTPEEAARSMREGAEKWGRLVRELGIRL
ncbi:MAG: tripartite tricarboxylate transporter substrate binding protein [Proteobacteria bacterium]|nr:tripartite tricarboxylate transporter substrate binding protein [Burkholderiales bacterium]